MARIPRVNFVYSYIYDSTLSSLMKKRYEYSRRKAAMSYIKRLDKAFGRHSAKALAGMSEVSGLKWRKDQIEAYVVKYAPYSFSIPLTLRMYRGMDLCVAILVHELVHNLVQQNSDRIRYRKLFKDYRRESANTQFHIIEGSILLLLNRRLFGHGSKGFFKYDDWNAVPKYRRAMDIASADPEKILKKYIK